MSGKIEIDNTNGDSYSKTVVVDIEEDWAFYAFKTMVPDAYLDENSNVVLESRVSSTLGKMYKINKYDYNKVFSCSKQQYDFYKAKHKLAMYTLLGLVLSLGFISFIFNFTYSYYIGTYFSSCYNNYKSEGFSIFDSSGFLSFVDDKTSSIEYCYRGIFSTNVTALAIQKALGF